MKSIKINIDRVIPFVSYDIIKSLQKEANIAYKQLNGKAGKGNDFLGWLHLPGKIFKSKSYNKIITESERIKKISEVIVVIGIGGSYLGARAVISALSHSFPEYKKGHPRILYAGHNMSSSYLNDLLNFLNNKDYSIVVISKSGTTTEPALAFRLLKKHIEKKYGKINAGKRIIAITDKEKGALKKLADKENYTTFIIPDDVGGRYSVFSPVGLLPVAVAGFDISSFLRGGAYMQNELLKSPAFKDNPACLYAALRNALYRTNKSIEIMASFEPEFFYITEWWKQLFGESEGKDGKGIFPAGVIFSTDLHSLGQYIQEGQRIIFETMLLTEKPRALLKVPHEKTDDDGLNYLADKSIHDINCMATLGTSVAHTDGGVPVIEIRIPEINEFYLGQLLYFFEFACGISGYMLDVNPFDQPGVEAYKNNMFALLGKPGFEKQQKEILKKIN